ncbi:hypothetical protein BASA61_007138 [Batrachochytrium salamandrivorans]|nr:hypothetical protein BASA61_007138 [Batrachochytrium salamandrivorans]
MPLPAYFKMGIFQYYTHFRKTKQYRIFTEKEGMYFRSEYSSKEKLGRGKFGAVYLATKKSNGMEVAYKSIPKSKVRRYTLESNTSPICHPHNPLVGSEEPSVAQCMSSRPPNLLLPYEFMLQMYLSRPGHENPYVPEVFDYFILKNGTLLFSTSIAHLVVECEQVTGHRIQSGLVPAIQKSRLRLLGRALDPGVENVYTWLRGGVLNGEADPDQLLIGRDCGA